MTQQSNAFEQIRNTISRAQPRVASSLHAFPALFSTQALRHATHLLHGMLLRMPLHLCHARQPHSAAAAALWSMHCHLLLPLLPTLQPQLPPTAAAPLLRWPRPTHGCCYCCYYCCVAGLCC